MKIREKSTMEMGATAVYVGLCLLCFLAAFCLKNSELIFHSVIKGSDYSLIALKAFQARSFGVFVGPYSRFGFNHPGPVQFYLYALAEQLLPASYSAAHAIAQLVLNFTCFASMLFLLLRKGVKWAAPILVCLLLVNYYLNFTVLSDTWGPSVIQFPYALFLISSACLLLQLQNRKFDADEAQISSSGLLIAAALSGCWVVSNHIGLLLPVGLVSIVVGVFGKIWRLSKRELLAPTLIAALFIILPLIELCFGASPNNLERFLKFLQRYDPTVSSAEVLRQVYFILPLRGGELILIPLLLLLIGDKGRRALRPYLGVFGAAILGSFLSLNQTVGRLYSYLFWPFMTAGALLIGALLGEFFERGKFFPERLLKFALPIALALVGWSFTHDPGRSPSGYKKIMEIVDREPAGYFRLHAKKHQNWEAMTAVADTLARRGTGFCVQERLKFLFGAEWSCNNAALRVPDNAITIWCDQFE